MGEPGELRSMGSHRVGHDLSDLAAAAAAAAAAASTHWRRKWQSTPVFCLENPRDGGAWWAAVYGIAQSLT